MIVYNKIPCPILKFEVPDSYLILFKEEQKWIYESSLGYGEILKDEINGIHYIINNKYHREKGPAEIYYNLTNNEYQKRWYQNGLIHRLNGPAIENSDGTKEYLIESKYYSEKDYWKKIKELI